MGNLIRHHIRVRLLLDPACAFEFLCRCPKCYFDKVVIFPYSKFYNRFIDLKVIKNSSLMFTLSDSAINQLARPNKGLLPDNFSSMLNAHLNFAGALNST